MSEAVASLHEVARFLREYAPFDAMRPEEVDELASSARIEFVRKGTVIFGQDVPCQDNSFVVRSGAVELIDGDTVIDVLGPGEVFGHPSMMSGLPTSAASRADRLEGAVARPLLARPEGMRFVARTLLERYRRATGSSPLATDLMAAPIAQLVRGPVLICTADMSLREAAQRMTTAGQSSLVVELERHRWGCWPTATCARRSSPVRSPRTTPCPPP
jgi:CBS domain-containing protein